MIDLHSHILPGIDDGATSLDVSIEMARIAVADGIEVMACTPHIYPGLYMNDAAGIRSAMERLQRELDGRQIALRLVAGADVHLVPGLVAGIREGRVPTLHGSRYLLLEPSHHVPPPRLEDSVFQFLIAGFVPVITHPERLAWVGDHYESFRRMAEHGVWIQLTAGSLTGAFGPKAREWSERFLDDGLVHLLATDAHTTGRRRPVLSEAVRVAARRVGDEEARRMVVDRPKSILENRPPAEVHRPAIRASTVATGGFWRRWFGRQTA